MKNFFLVLCLLVLGACSTVVKPYSGSAPAGADNKKMQTAITKAAIERGWMAKDIGNGTMELTLNNRSHMVVVDVKYDTKGYTINYKDSTNMKYNPNNMSIHKKYNNWVTNLKRSIDLNLIQ